MSLIALTSKQLNLPTTNTGLGTLKLLLEEGIHDQYFRPLFVFVNPISVESARLMGHGNLSPEGKKRCAVLTLPD